MKHVVSYDAFGEFNFSCKCASCSFSLPLGDMFLSCAGLYHHWAPWRSFTTVICCDPCDFIVCFGAGLGTTDHFIQRLCFVRLIQLLGVPNLLLSCLFSFSSLWVYFLFINLFCLVVHYSLSCTLCLRSFICDTFSANFSFEPAIFWHINSIFSFLHHSGSFCDYIPNSFCAMSIDLVVHSVVFFWQQHLSVLWVQLEVCLHSDSCYGVYSEILLWFVSICEIKHSWLFSAPVLIKKVKILLNVCHSKSSGVFGLHRRWYFFGKY